MTLSLSLCCAVLLFLCMCGKNCAVRPRHRDSSTNIYKSASKKNTTAAIAHFAAGTAEESRSRDYIGCENWPQDTSYTCSGDAREVGTEMEMTGNLAEIECEKRCKDKDTYWQGKEFADGEKFYCCFEVVEEQNTYK